MPEARHAVRRRGSTSRRKRRRSGRLLRLVLPVAGVGAVAGAVVGVTTFSAPPGGAPVVEARPVSPAPFDVDGLRQDAAGGAARSERGGPAPLAGDAEPIAPSPTAAPTPSSTPTPTPSSTPSPTPTATGFAPVEGCDAVLPGRGVGNGELGDEHLCDVGNGHRLRLDAAAAFVALAEFYREETGESLVACVTDSYRSYEAQAELADRKPGLAAAPGTSEHGWGLAVDIGCGANTFTGPLYGWLDANAEAYGWENPGWARPGGRTPEPWHWEFDADS